MRINVKTVLLMAGSFALGVSIGKEQNKQKWMETAEREIDEVRTYFHKKLEEVSQDVERRVHDDAVEEAAKALMVYKGQPEVPYNKPKEEEPRHKEIPDSRPPIDPIYTANPDSPTVVITADEYTASEIGYEAVNLKYYRGDDTLATVDDKIITMEERATLFEGLVGPDMTYDERDGFAYFRCHRIQTDFEIEVAIISFKAEALGESG